MGERGSPVPTDASPVDVRDVTLGYATTTVVTGLTLSVAAGETVALTGSNGSGKSTLLRACAGLLPVTAGDITLCGLDGRAPGDVPAEAVHGVLDDVGWLPGLTVRDHYDLMTGGRPYPDGALDHLDVGGLLSRHPDSLSAGQRQRVALTTALLRPWTVLLLDEPESHLDATGVASLAAALDAVTSATSGVLMSTHSPDLVEATGARVVDLDRG